ncbi:hypothetical protein [Halapricum hydrolyticum]|uniref:Uncharacterized protein n=1 Tax=Halapricum hydrolyticum TaxID=2979991 RepID=A0AAE3IA25_9EURY|nr:hypothetical protein [Halapricum hydrolyticum]MCU4716551.1 hypothetical protein [Halapricum hydrolyticum]MCU4725844.1 hypothetical protein [Halapricum hydrolyticum]
MLENSAKHTTINYWIVEECRGCGRSYAVRAPVAAGDGGSDVRTKCRCGTTNPTDVGVTEPEQIAEVVGR